MAKRGIESLYNRVGKELHSKKTLDNVPVRWRSAVDHPETQLAYITDEEAALLKKLDIHNSGVRYNHHIGPHGIPSYNGAGSGDSVGGGNDSAGGSPAGDGGGVAGGGSFGGGGPGEGVGTSAGEGSSTGDGSSSPGTAGGSTDTGGATDTGGGGTNVGGTNVGGTNVGGTDVGGTTPGSSLADAMGATQAGAFGTTGVVGVDASTTPEAMAAQGIAPTADVSTSLSSMGLGDVAMGGFGVGGITGTGTDADGVSGQGMGAGIAGGLGGLGSLGAALGNTSMAGFGTNMSGFSSTPSSTPFGGASLSPSAQGYASPSTGMGFGIGPSGISMGAPYSGADIDTGMLGTSGVPGTRGNVLAEQAAQMAAQMAATPTVELSPTVTNEQISAAVQSGTLSSLAIGSTLAAAAATPAPATAPDVSVSTAVSAPATTPDISVSPTVSAPATTPDVSVAPTSVSPTSAPSTQTTSTSPDVTAPGRSASSLSMESFNDPLTGAPVSVSTLDGVQTISLGTDPAAQSGIAGFLGNPTVSTLANAALSAAIPNYGLANLASLGLTGSSLLGQGVSIATGQGPQFGGGLIGAVTGGGPTAGYGTGPSNPNAAQSGAGGGNLTPQINYSDIISAQQKSGGAIAPTTTPVSYDLSQFMSAPAATPPVAQQYDALPIPQAQPITYGRYYLPVGPGIASIPTIFNAPTGTTQYYG